MIYLIIKYLILLILAKQYPIYGVQWHPEKNQLYVFTFLLY